MLLALEKVVTPMEKNCFVVAPWAGYTDAGHTSFVNSVSDPCDRREAERLVCALSAVGVECSDAESAETAVASGRAALGPAEHRDFMQQASDAGKTWLTTWNPDGAGALGQADGDEATTDGENTASLSGDSGASEVSPDTLDPTENDPAALSTQNGLPPIPKTPRKR